MNLAIPPWAYTTDGQVSYPSEAQATFRKLVQTHDRVYYMGGLGAGKTWVGAWTFLLLILQNRAGLQEAGRGGELKYLCGAPDYQSIDEGCWSALNEILDEFEQLNGFDLRHRVLKTHPRSVTLITGDVIKFISTDSGRYKAANAAGCWLDEAEESEDPVGSYHLLAKRLRSPKVKRRFLIVTSTPPEEGQGLYNMWATRVADGDESFAMVHGRTDSNPAWDGTDYYNMLKGTMSRVEVESKLHGKPQPPSGTVYGREWSRANLVSWAWGGKPRQDREYWLALDWGSHYSALLLEHDPAADVDIVIDEHHQDGGQDFQFLDRVVQLIAKYGLTRKTIDGVWCDANPKEARRLCYSTRYFRGKVSYKRTDKDRKRQGIATVKWRLDPGTGEPSLYIAKHLIASPYKRGIVRSIKAYKWKERRIDQQVVTLARVNQEHWSSHVLDALRYYLYGRHGRKRLRAQGRSVASV